MLEKEKKILVLGTFDSILTSWGDLGPVGTLLVCHVLFPDRVVLLVGRARALNFYWILLRISVVKLCLCWDHEILMLRLSEMEASEFTRRAWFAFSGLFLSDFWGEIGFSIFQTFPPGNLV